MPRYVILEHDHPAPHWDLMLEADDVLKTWRLPIGLPPDAVRAEPIGDHRLMYLDYEGPVSGNRGTVKRWDGGEYQVLCCSPTEWSVLMRGERWRGSLVLPLTGENVGAD